MGIQIRKREPRKKKDPSRKKIRPEQDGCYRLVRSMSDPEQQKERELLLSEFEIPSRLGNEIEAMHRVTRAVAGLNLPEVIQERLKTAVAEATMNAMEHGNHFDERIPVVIRVAMRKERLYIEISDQGGLHEIPAVDAPDLEAKLAGLQSPRGWGLFLIQNMVDEMQVRSDGSTHTVILIFHLPSEIP